jgi:hypothetical protein
MTFTQYVDVNEDTNAFLSNLRIRHSRPLFEPHFIITSKLQVKI